MGETCRVMSKAQLLCVGCESEIYKCDDCNEYFHVRQTILCTGDGEHVCMDCSSAREKKPKECVEPASKRGGD